MDHFLYNASQPDLNNDGHHLFLWKRISDLICLNTLNFASVHLKSTFTHRRCGISGSCSHMTSSLQDRALTCTCGLHC